MEYYNKIDNVYLQALKENIIYPKFKLELMDFAENVIEEITQDISNADSGSISINYQQGVRRSCSITLINLPKNFQGEQGQYNPQESGIWITTKFKLYIGIRVPKQKVTLDSEDDIYWFPQGVFLITNPNVLRDMSKKTITINGVDKFGVFGAETNYNQTEATYLITAGSTVGNAIRSILQFDKGNGLPLDTQEPYIDPSIASQTLPKDVNKSPTTYFSEILTELANIFACDIFYDANGRLNFVKGNETQDMNSNSSLWDYKDTSAEYFSPQLNYDFTSVYNSIKVIGNNPASDIFVYTAKNTDPSSPTRIQLIGEKILYIESSFCYNLDRTKDFANYMLRKKSMVPLTLSFQSSLIPHLDVNNVITITDNYYGYVNQRFIIQSLTIPLSTKSLIDVNATNSAVIPYFEY